MGQQVLVDTHPRHTRDCRSGLVPRFTLAQPPEHGRVERRQGMVTARPNAVGTVDGTGADVRAILVYDIPADGYAGHDTFHDELRIETRSAAAARGHDHRQAAPGGVRGDVTAGGLRCAAVRVASGP